MAEPPLLQIGINSVTLLEVTRQTIHIPVIFEDLQVTERALIDSGAGGNFISEELARKLRLPRTELRRHIVVKNVDGTRNVNGIISHRTITTLVIAGRRQTVSFLITGLGDQRLILGLPWLIKENPILDWKAGTLQWTPEQLEFDKETLFVNLIDSYGENASDSEELIFIRKTKMSEKFDQLYGKAKKAITSLKDAIPKTYHKFLKIFDKKTAERFPKATPYDHEIHLKPDFKEVRQQPYLLNPEETKLAREFIKENLEKGYIVPSKSPIAASLLC